MRKKRKIKPRKEPQQGRSQETRNCVIQAAAEVLSKVGYRKFSTKDVAKRAGVSVGSLYQYYPNKDALVAAVLQRRGRKQIENHHRIISQESDCIEKTLSKLFEANCLNLSQNSKLHRTLIESTHKLGLYPSVLKGEREVIQSTQKFLEKHATKKQDMRKIAFIINHAHWGIVRACLLQKPSYLTDPEFMELHRQLIIEFSKKLS